MRDTTRRHLLYATGGASVTAGGPTKARASDRSLFAPVLPLNGARYLPRFHMVDYFAEVWVNEKRAGLQGPADAVCGAIQTSGGRPDYRADAVIAVQKFGEGQFLLNTLRIRQNLGRVPAAEHLLRNMICYGGQGR